MKSWFVMFFIWVICTNTLLGQSQTIQFETLSVEDGLSHNTVNYIFQDSHGFMWFSTSNGLNRYDGNHFIVYQRTDQYPHSLSGNVISNVVEDSTHCLWIAIHGGGLNKYNPVTDEYVHFIHDPNDSTSINSDRLEALFLDHNGKFWIGTEEGLDYFDPETTVFTHYLFGEEDNDRQIGNPVIDIAEDDHGNIWIGTAHGLYCYNRKIESWTHYCHNDADGTSLSHDNINVLMFDHEGSLWIGTNKGLDNLKPGSSGFIHYKHNPADPNSISDNFVWRIYEDRSNVLWVGTFDKGLNRFNKKNKQFQRILYNPLDPHSINDNYIRSIYEDRSGLLWVGTWKGDLNKGYVKARKFELLQLEADVTSADFLHKNDVVLVYEDPENPAEVFWIGTRQGGLYLYHRKQGMLSPFLYTDIPRINRYSYLVQSICRGEGDQYWIGTGRGLDLFHRDTGHIDHYEYEQNNPHSLSHNRVHVLLRDQKGAVWVGTEYGGLNRFDPKTQRFQRFLFDPKKNNSLGHNYVISIYEDTKGTLWVGTNGGGLNQYQPETETFTRFQLELGNPKSVSDNVVICLFEDSQKRFWLGTNAGLDLFDRSTGTATKYGKQQGLQNEMVFDIEEDSQGHLWLSTAHGISMFDPSAETFINYDKQDGVQKNEFNWNAGCKSTAGEIFFGGHHGMNIFSPDSIEVDHFIPPIFITDFKLFNQSVSVGQIIDGKKILRKSIIATDSVRLPYTLNMVSFEYAALHYGAPHENQFAYRLEGLEKEWNYVQNQSFVTYSELSPGNYTFHVKAANPDGVWNEEGRSLHIYVSPPFWQTLWFKGVLLLLLVLFIIGIIRIRTLAFQRRNRILTKLVKERTRELEKAQKQLLIQERMAALGQLIATVAHEIRNPLGTVRSAVFSMTNALVSSGNTKAKRASELAERNIIRCDNIITELLSFTRKKKLEIVCVRLDHWLHVVLDELDIPGYILLTLNLAENLKVRIDSEDMRRAIINVVENALQAMDEDAEHRNHCLNIEARKQDAYNILSFCDTGPGILENEIERVCEPLFSTKNFGVGLGIPIVKKIMEEHQGKFVIQSKPGEGTCVELWLPAC